MSVPSPDAPHHWVRNAAVVLPQVSVVIVTYRSQDHIDACLSALRHASDGLAREVFVVDNSPDEYSATLVRSRFPDCRLLRTGSNVGFSRAVNLAAKSCKAPYLLLLNPDARLSRDGLRLMREALDHDEAAAAAGPSLLWPDGRLQVSARPRLSAASLAFESLLLDGLWPSSPLVETRASSEIPLEVECLSGACMLVRRAAFDALGGFDERFFLYGEDVDFCERARARGLRLLLVPLAIAEHDVAASCRLDPRRFQADLHRSKVQLILKHFGPTLRLLLVGLHVLGLSLRASLHALQGLFPRHRERLERAGHEFAALACVMRLLARQLVPSGGKDLAGVDG